jgi:hypothetical protein
MQPTAPIVPAPSLNNKIETKAKTAIENLQVATKHLVYLVPIAIAVVNTLLSSHVFHWNVDTIALVNGLLAALGLSSLHINSLGD